MDGDTRTWEERGQAITDRHTVALQGTRVSMLVEGDALRLEQALQNLLANAVKYSPNGGRIEAALAQDAGRAWLTVRDWGIGIPAEAIPQIFERFYRPQRRSRRHKRAGSGPVRGAGDRRTARVDDLCGEHRRPGI